MNIRKESLNFILLLGLTAIPCLANAQSVMSVLKQESETISFAEALEATGLDEQLEQLGPYTVFAPTNEAFRTLTNGINSNSERMRDALLNHIMTGLATERSIKVMTKATSLGGLTLRIEVNGDQIIINNARLISTNIRAGNGVIHVVDRVLR